MADVRFNQPMIVSEERFEFRATPDYEDLLIQLGSACKARHPGALPIRAVITETTGSGITCELGILSNANPVSLMDVASPFEFRQRFAENTEHFTVVLLVPTGVGAAIGGHAGDAGPVARMIAQVSDRLIVHPNVVNASDINEIPENALYVEGSVVTRLVMGTIGLQPVRSNRVLVVIDSHEDELFTNAAINSVSGARAAYGLHCPEVVCLDPPIRLESRYSPSGRATGVVDRIEGVLEVLNDRRAEFDAVALSSIVEVPSEFHQAYFEADGEMVNPWGGVEALLTHTLSSVFDIPTAHAPMLESREIANADPGVVDPRLAPEAVSMTYMQCVLKGLHRSPRIIRDAEGMAQPGVLTAADISCLVVPDGCLGLPTLAALEQGISVIAVRENQNLMKNDLARLPWAPGQFHRAANYWEVAGLIASMRAGIDPASIRRPLATTHVTRANAQSKPVESQPLAPLATRDADLDPV